MHRRDGAVYFRALHEEFGEELWKSDGTMRGTVLVKNIFPGFYDDVYGPNDRIPSGFPSYPEELTNVAGTLFFAAYAPGVEWGLWKSDGSEAGTVMVTDTVFPADMIAAGSLPFFTPYVSP